MHTQHLSQLATALADRTFSAVELTQHFLGRISASRDALNAVITECPDEALAAAEASDKRRASGTALGPLDGIPILHKDVFCTDGLRTACGSRILDSFVAPYDATVVARMRAAGVVCLGKTNMDEFAMGSSNEHSYYGNCKNPWDLERVPGGSSGGSASAVAARLAPLATGTDTGGSIRQPAAFCGITGLKPTYGRVSRWGMVAFASSLDQGGLFAPAAADIAVTLGTIAGLDPLDSTSADEPVPDYAATLADPLRGLRVGIAREHFGDGLDVDVGAAVHAGAAELERLGATLVDVSLAESELTVPTYYVIALAEASSNLSRFDGVRYGHRAEADELDELYERTRAEGFGDEVKRRIMLGTYALSAGYYDAYYRKAQQLRRIISEDFAAAFEHVDVLLAPTTPTPAFKLGELIDDPVTMYLTDIYTCAINLAGLPSCNIPVGQSAQLPVGAQIIGPHFSEARILNVAHQFQQATDWHTRMPPAAQLGG